VREGKGSEFVLVTAAEQTAKSRAFDRETFGGGEFCDTVWINCEYRFIIKI
jgi:hypothetical protein